MASKLAPGKQTNTSLASLGQLWAVSVHHNGPFADENQLASTTGLTPEKAGMFHTTH
jgi:hypothetical protein